MPHSQEVKPRLRFRCCKSWCLQTFARASDARRHEKEVHQDLIKHICRFPECRFRGFKRAYLLRDHYVSFHQSVPEASGHPSNRAENRYQASESTHSSPSTSPSLGDQSYTFIAGRFMDVAKVTATATEISSTPSARGEVSSPSPSPRAWNEWAPSTSTSTSPLPSDHIVSDLMIGPELETIPIFDYVTGSYVWIQADTYRYVYEYEYGYAWSHDGFLVSGFQRTDA